MAGDGIEGSHLVKRRIVAQEAAMSAACVWSPLLWLLPGTQMSEEPMG